MTYIFYILTLFSVFRTPQNGICWPDFSNKFHRISNHGQKNKFCDFILGRAKQINAPELQLECNINCALMFVLLNSGRKSKRSESTEQSKRTDNYYRCLFESERLFLYLPLSLNTHTSSHVHAPTSDSTDLFIQNWNAFSVDAGEWIGL